MTKTINKRRFKITTDITRDALLTDFGKDTLDDRYLLPGETYQDLFARVADAYADDKHHAQRLYDYISRLWFMPATPILSNGGTNRGLPISCFLNSVSDSLGEIVDTWNENVWLASRGGGIGTYWGNVRGIGEPVGINGKTSGIIPFIRVMDSLTLAISQGCVDGQTEILTENGWVRFDELTPAHGKVAQVNPSRSITFVDVQEYHEYDYDGVMHHYTAPSGTVDHFVTPNHRMIYETVKKTEDGRVWGGVLKVKESSDFKVHRDNRLYATGVGVTTEDKPLSDLERFQIAYQADGATNPSGSSNGNISGSVIYAFRFRRERKIERFRELIGRLGWHVTESTYDNGTTSLLVRVPLNVTPSKLFSEWVNLAEVGTEWCRDFIDEMRNWDGSGNDKHTIRFDSTVKENADVVNAVACLAGYKSFSAEQSRETPRKNIYKAHIHTGKITIGGEKINKVEVPFVGKVYCVSVPSGAFLARRNGKVLVTGNSLRRGSAACYLDVSHPEIEEFLEIRKPSGDFNRKALNLHHGVLLTDAFMEAVKAGEKFDLVSPATGEKRAEIDARSFFQKLVETRLATGEPYIVFSDTVNRAMPKHHRELGLKVSTSNLCAEITLPTGIDHLGKDRTAVCCLSSVNLDKWDEWNGNPQFIEDVMRMLDNVLQDFIDRAPDEMERAKYSASRERSVGLGVMGFHTFLQNRSISFESPMAKVWNLKMFKHISSAAQEASLKLGEERGPCPDADERGYKDRFSCKMAIAPTASISIICGGSSACIEPIPANIYTHKTLSGSFTIKNPALERVLDKHSANTDSTWNSILEKGGSVQHLACLSEEEKAVFKTSFEIDQRWLIEFAADRAPMIDQAQSLNLFIPADVDKWDLTMLHFQAWEKGVKSLYYLRSKSIQRAGFAGGVESDNTVDAPKFEVELTDYSDCLSCQ